MKVWSLDACDCNRSSQTDELSFAHNGHMTRLYSLRADKEFQKWQWNWKMGIHEAQLELAVEIWLCYFSSASRVCLFS